MPLTPPEITPPDGKRDASPYIPLLAYVVGVFFLALAGYQGFRQIEGLIQQEKLNDLNAIAAAKIGQIVSWREAQERRGEAVSRATLLPPEFDQWVREGAPAGPRKQNIVQLMSGLQQVYGYRAVALLDRRGAVRLASSSGAALEAEDVALVQQAMDGRRSILSDIHADKRSGEIHLDLAAPLIVYDGNRSRVVGAAILQINPADYLFPLIQVWPVNSSTAETLLVRPEGENLLFLNKVRHSESKAMTLRRPINTPDLPPGMFLRGKLDPLNSVDYRGVAVVASVSRIPGTSWLMVAKVDKEELFAPILRLKRGSAAVGLVFLVGCGMLFFVWLRGAQAHYRHIKAQRDAALNNEMLLKHFEYLAKYANDIIFVANENREIIEANERAVSAYGYTRDELLGMPIWALRPPTSDFDVYNQQMERLREAGEHIFETVNRRKDGSTFPVEVSARVIEVEGVKYLQGILRDITERKAAERRIVRLNELYAAINQTNAAIVRIKNQTALFQEICRIAVAYGHFRLAWVGMVDAENRYVMPVVSAGPCAGYLDDLIIPLNADKPEGQGPTATALHRGQAIVCKDFETDPRVLPWRDNARKYGLRSSASWPLRLAGKAVGVLTLYAGEVDYFDDDMMTLLSSIAQDTSFALDNLAMEESLRQSEEKFRTLVENLPQNIFVKDSNSIYVSCNQAYARALGITPNQISGMTDYDFYPTELADKYRSDDRYVLNSGKVEEIQEEYIEQGQRKIVHTIKVPFKNQQGDLTGVLGMFWDITERKREEALALHFGRLLQNSFNEIYLFDANSLLFLETSEGARINLGYSADELSQMTPLDIKPSFNPERFEQLVAPLHSGEQALLLFETFHRRKDGTTYPVEVRLQLMQGEPSVFLAIIQDVTERKLAENELLRQKEFFRQVIDADSNLIFVKDAEGRLLLANQAMASLYGMTQDEMLSGKYLAQLEQYSNEANLYMEMDREVIQNRQPVSLVHPSRLGGEERWFLNTKTPMVLPDGTVNVLGISVDITELKLAENMLRKSADLIEDLYNNAPCGYHSLDKDGIIIQINNTELQWLGYTREEVVGKMNIRDFHTPRSRQLLEQSFSLFKEKGYVNDLDFEFVRKDGSVLPVMVNGIAIYGQNGEFATSRSTVFDDTTRRQAHVALWESEARFHAMADNAPIIIWMADAQSGQNYSGCGFFNQAWHGFTGLTLAQVPGQNWLELVHPDDRALCLYVYQEAFRLAESFKHEYRLMRRDGIYRWMLDSGVPRFTEEGELLSFIGTCIDVTEEKNSEAMRGEIERVGRLNIAVEMASGLAHELSQPLSAANNYLAGCLHRMKEADWDKEKLRTAVARTYKQTERAGSIINHLKELIRNQGHERSLIDINMLIRDTVNFIEHEIKRHGIVVSMELPPLPLVKINKIEIEQVLLNLLKNAIEAMHDAPEPVLRIATTIQLCNSQHILVTISDTGQGISSAELAMIFNPFQTSKNDGLGLGLSICRSLVENHGGFIWADAQREFGAEFNFTLPYEANHE